MDDKKTILLIEDDQMLLRLLAKSFEKVGFIVLTADNGKDGIEVASKKQPDIIVLDIILPQVDGVTVYKALQAAKAPIVVWTNLAQKEVEAAIGEPGIDYLAKAECSLEKLVTHIQQIVEKK